jgi:hypothetical protein
MSVLVHRSRECKSISVISGEQGPLYCVQLIDGVTLIAAKYGVQALGSRPVHFNSR